MLTARETTQGRLLSWNHGHVGVPAAVSQWADRRGSSRPYLAMKPVPKKTTRDYSGLLSR